MTVFKIVVIFMAIFFMEVVGAWYMERHENKDRKSMIFLGIMLFVGGVLSVVLVMKYPGNTFVHNIRLAFLYGILCPIAVIDFRIQKIPNKLLLWSTLTWGITVIFEVWKNREMVFDDVKSSVVAAMAVFIVCMICKLLIKNSIGMGDIKLFMVMGLFQGVVGMSGAIFTSLIVAFFGALLLMVLRKKGRKDQISFGPFILIGTTISMFLTGV